jgi:hypothetical integral membrane protein (TIGR02206 family)
MAQPFVPFGVSHCSAIALGFAVPLGLAALTRQRAALDKPVRWLLAGLIVANRILWLVLIEKEGWVSAQNLLPMHLCDWASIAAAITLLWPNQRSYELAYFWAFSGTLQAMLTPELAVDFPDLRFIIFFVSHCTVIASVLYLTLARGMRPYPSSLPRVAAWSLGYTALAIAINTFAGTNFGYLRHKPFTPSLLDYLAPWPWYILEMVAIGIVSLLIYYAPFFIADLLRRRRAAHI